MYTVGDVVLAGYGMKYVVKQVNRATYDVLSLYDVERGYAYAVSRHPMKQLDRCKLIDHISLNLPEEPETIAYNTGDILYDSWGWEQTNIDFYQVVKSTNKTVWIREIDQIKTEKDMRGTCVPVPDSFKGETRQRGIKIHGDKQFVNSKYGSMSLWDGRPKEFTTYA